MHALCIVLGIYLPILFNANAMEGSFLSKQIISGNINEFGLAFNFCVDTINFVFQLYILSTPIN